MNILFIEKHRYPHFKTFDIISIAVESKKYFMSILFIYSGIAHMVCKDIFYRDFNIA